jgi:hypothetical protein
MTGSWTVRLLRDKSRCAPPPALLAAAVLGLLLASACGGGDGVFGPGSAADGRTPSADDQGDAEDFAVQFIHEVQKGNQEWIGNHCDDREGCEGSYYAGLAYCASYVEDTIVRRHPDPQGQWLVTVAFSPSCVWEDEDWGCILLDVGREDGVWKADIPVGPSRDKESCQTWQP